MNGRRVKVYYDYKSPFSYLAMAELYEMEKAQGSPFEWLPWNYPIAKTYGAIETRTKLQENRLRYLYQEVRAQGAARNLVIKPPKKIFDSTLAGVGALFAARAGKFHRYNDRVFAAFWRRELDIENVDGIAGALESCGEKRSDFLAFVDEGRARMKEIETQLLEEGVFGIPSVVVGGKIFWGRERLSLAQKAIAES